MFATWYTYDVDGTPLWLSALTKRQGMSNVYSGPLNRIAVTQNKSITRYLFAAPAGTVCN